MLLPEISEEAECNDGKKCGPDAYLEIAAILADQSQITQMSETKLELIPA